MISIETSYPQEVIDSAWEIANQTNRVFDDINQAEKYFDGTAHDYSETHGKVIQMIGSMILFDKLTAMVAPIMLAPDSPFALPYKEEPAE